MSARLLPLSRLPAPGDVGPARRRLCVLLACFNRRDATLACLRALAASTGLGDLDVCAVLVDDGSTDGTAARVRIEHPWVHVVPRDAAACALFWCRGMHRAFDEALRVGFDDYLWLNDDTLLQRDALARLLATRGRLRARAGAAPIVVGSTVDAATGQLTYGGELLPWRWRPLASRRVRPGDVAQRCDTMTGNVVLISAAAARRVGNLDPRFEHAMGDTDYGLRAVACGVELWVDAGIHGTCSDNPVSGSWRDASQPLRLRWRAMMSRKGVPWRSWLLMTRRHAGPLWPLYFVLPYAKVVAQGLIDGLPRRLRGVSERRDLGC